MGDGWRHLTVTPQQATYINNLCTKLGIDWQCPPGLSRGDASDLIDDLQRQDRGETVVNPRFPLGAVYDLRRKTIEHRRSQKAQFGGKPQRAEPKGRGRPAKVWKRSWNLMGVTGHIDHGWAWSCTYPEFHRARAHSGNARYTHEQALAKLDEHLRKRHGS